MEILSELSLFIYLLNNFPEIENAVRQTLKRLSHLSELSSEPYGAQLRPEMVSSC